MKRAIILLLTILLVSGCSANPDAPPQITVSTSGGAIDSIVGIDAWNGVVYDRLDGFSVLMKDKSKEDLTYIKLGDEILMELEGGAPDSVVLEDYILTLEGGLKYSTITKNEIPVEFENQQAAFVLEINYNAFLSSQLSDYEKGSTIRGFKLICRWGENECEYAFVIRTDAQQDMQ